MQGILVKSKEKNTYQIGELSPKKLNDTDLKIRVQYSSINYKDALAVLGESKILKSYPMIPGIDAAGIVESSSSNGFPVGSKVLVNGSGFGETRDGGLCGVLYAPEDLLVKVPEHISLEDCMCIGTAGYTAKLAMHQLVKNDLPKDKPVVVTGASGGVGSFSVILLASAGYDVIAISSKKEKFEYLKNLGANEVCRFDELEIAKKETPLGKALYAGAIDNLGGQYLAKLLSHIDLFGSVASIGLASDAFFSSSVMPHILRGVNLLGVSSANSPMKLRRDLWGDLFADKSFMQALTKIEKQVIGLEQVPELCQDILQAKHSGRSIVSFLD
ncbi:MAG: YhdH/YhfP family quinone oxidoreductase [Bdellovibrionota bacterium]